jgi:organic radical activating enzyme
MNTLPVMEQFLSLQGEGSHSGRPAYFIRLGGCSVGCVWCDVKESWEASSHPQRSVIELADAAVASGAPSVVVTGGEPCTYDLRLLCQTLHGRGLQLWLETSGVYPILGEFDWICLSPKKFKEPLTESLALAHEFKVVVYHPSDLDWMQNFVRHLDPQCRLFVQPEWSKREQIGPLLVRFVQENPGWTLSMQTHKYLEIP